MTNVRRISNHYIKSVHDPKHPFRVKPIGGGVLVVRVPTGNPFSISVGHAESALTRLPILFVVPRP